jgi:hypothetical protein
MATGFISCSENMAITLMEADNQCCMQNTQENGYCGQ